MFAIVDLIRDYQTRFDFSNNNDSITDQTHNFSVAEMFKRALAGSPVPDNQTEPLYDTADNRNSSELDSAFVNQIGVGLEELGDKIRQGEMSISEANSKVKQAETALAAAKTEQAKAAGARAASQVTTSNTSADVSK